MDETLRNSPSGFEEREHTADVSIFVWADTIENLFAQAGKAMVEILKPDYKPETDTIRLSISVQGEDLESLLVAYLSELIFLLDERNLVFSEHEIQINVNQLEAQITGREIRNVEREIKAATYSNLMIEKTVEGYSTQVVFDI